MAATTGPIQSTFKRQPLPLIARYAIGASLYGVGKPLVGGLNLLGLTESAFGSANARQYRKLQKNNPFGSYRPDEHDVIVATYAKSGTNWMMQIAHQLAFHGRAEFDHIHSVVPWPDSPHVLGKYAIPLEDPTVWKASPEQKRVIKTHLNWELIPYSQDARYIMVIRDPKDVFVSNFLFARNLAGPIIPSMQSWYRLFVSENFPMGGSWAVNAAGYWAQRHQPNVLVLSFKSMKRDLIGAVNRVAEFMQVRVPQTVIEDVCLLSSFDSMKLVDNKFNVWKTIPWGAEGTMIRRGSQGKSSELLNPSAQRHIDAYFMAELKRLGSDLPYEDFCDIAG